MAWGSAVSLGLKFGRKTKKEGNARPLNIVLTSAAVSSVDSICKELLLHHARGDSIGTRAGR